VSKAYVMPSLGAGMEAGTVIEWHVEPGQRVSRGQVVGVVDTEKGAIEIEIWQDAQVAEIVAPPGAKVPVGEPLLLLEEPAGGGSGEKGEGTPGTPAEAQEVRTPEPERGEGRRPEQPAEAPVAGEPETVEVVWEEEVEELPGSSEVEVPDAAPPAPGAPPPPPRARRRVRASPVARKRAEELGIDLAALQGSGPEGAITLADVEALAQGAPEREPAPPEGPSEGFAPEAGVDRHAAMRKAIAAAMSRSKREIPHYYLAHTCSLEPALRWLESANRDRPPARRLLLASLYLKAVARALGDFPEFSGFWEEDAFRPAAAVHPGLAISLRGGGLVAPAIHHVDDLTLDEVTTAIRDLVQRSRSGHLRGSEVSDPTITVTSLGDRGVEAVFGVIYPPQVAIVGIGTAMERPWVEGGMVGSHRVVTLSLAADHRASDGHRGALFLERIAGLLQSPEEL
jgi:pyruvate dehydrogenase E2 component (dihydrolipoamide acetyltransferase)